MRQFGQLIVYLLVVGGFWLNTVPIMAGEMPSPETAASYATGAVVPAYFDPDGGIGLLQGEKQDLSVMLRGNGEAVVLVRHTLVNTGDGDRTTARFTLPDGVTANNLIVYQYLAPPVCQEYDYQTSISPTPCKTYGDPDYRYPYYGGEEVRYTRLTPTLAGQAIDLTLAVPIATQKEGGIVMSFRTGDLVEKRFGGLFTYEVTSLAVPADISDLSIGLAVESDDLILKGTAGEVSYDQTAYTNLSAPAKEASFSSASLDQSLMSIGSGQLTKTASALAAGDTYTAKGSYATSWLRLNFLPGLIILVLLLFLILLTAWTTLRRKQLLAAASDERKPFITWWFEFWMSLLVALAVTGFTYLVNWLLSTLVYLSDGIVTFLILATAILAYAFFLLGFPIFVGLKRGWLRIFGLVLFEILWLAVIILLLLYFTGSFETLPSPMPMPLSD